MEDNELGFRRTLLPGWVSDYDRGWADGYGHGHRDGVDHARGRMGAFGASRSYRMRYVLIAAVACGLGAICAAAMFVLGIWR